LNHTANVLKRIDQLRIYGLDITPDWINYALIDDITDSFIPVIAKIDIEVESIDDLVLILSEAEQSDMLVRIGYARKKVLQLTKLLHAKSDVLKIVINRCIEKMEFDSDTRFYLSDIQDHVISMVSNLQNYEQTLARAHSNYLAQISIEITQASNRSSDVVLKMTAVASILVPLNVVTGLWGMNVKVPGQGENSLNWFFSILFCMVFFCALVLWIGRRIKLI
jgi:magnesium transporter